MMLLPFPRIDIMPPKVVRCMLRNPYSPECVELGFSDVGFPLYGVLRSSHSKNSTKLAPCLVTPLRARRAALVLRWLPYPVPSEVHAYSTSVTVSNPLSEEYMEPLRGRETLVREGANG